MATARKPAPRSLKKPAPRVTKTRAHLTRTRLVGVGAAVLALLLTIYIAAGLRTVSAYQTRLASDSFNFSGSFIFEGQDFLSPMNSNLDFSGAYSSKGPQPALSTAFIGSWATRDYSGGARLAAGRLYFNLSGPVMPVIRYRQGSFLLPLAAGQWYSAKADESLYDNICAHDQPASLQNKLALYRAVKSLQLMPSPWINFWTKLEDSSATRLTATLSGDQLATLWDAIQKASPPGCSDPNTLGITSSDLKHVAAHIELIAAHNGSADNLTVTLNDKTLGAKATFSLLTSHYGQASPAAAPLGTTNLNALYAGRR